MRGAQLESLLNEIELRQLQAPNIQTALLQAHWKIHGAGGAAELLGLKPTTLISRIKKLGLTKPVAFCEPLAKK